MEHVVDTVIIGAGPAGASCAITLQKNNYSCLLIDKKSFPRGKTCGGGVTEKTYELIRELLGGEAESVFCGESDIVELYMKDSLMTRANVGKKYRFIKREVFDNALVSEYKRLGGVMLEECVCKKIEPASKRLTLSNGDTVRYRTLVGADGAKSAVRRAFGIPEPRQAFCAECHVPRSAMEYDGAVRIYFGIIKKGYAWVFPSGDEVCIGLGGLAKKDDRFDLVLKEFTRALGVSAEYETKGAFLPYGEVADQSSLPDDTVLIGDAAGFADPLTGEGLYFALASGMAAARAAAGGSFKSEYLAETEQFRRTVEEGAGVQGKLFLPGAMTLVKKLVSGRPGFTSYVFDNIVSMYNYSYNDLKKLTEDYKKTRRIDRLIFSERRQTW